MMTRPLQKYMYVTPPRSSEAASPNVGAEVCFAVTTTAVYVNLQLLGQQAAPAKNAAQTKQVNGVVGQVITIYAETADLGIVFGAAVADVTAGNVPLLAAVGTLSGGVYTKAAKTCHRIPAGQERRYFLADGVDNFVGIVGSTTGICRMYQSSDPGI